MTDIPETAWVWAAKAIGAVAGSAVSLAYLLPAGRREAAIRFAVGLTCGLVFERRLAADAVTTEKVERISRSLDEQKRTLDDLALKRVRPALGDPVTRTPISEHKAAFSPAGAVPLSPTGHRS